ncbi:hypothetical protein SEA_VIEENROSE_32 [Streptomyces phage VieEnRose]|nr:hypothetical protein SEA_VIEENROSE_32 [Streptomyces phage VieEnRose]
MSSAFDEPHSFTTACGLISFTFDMEEYDFHLDAHEGYQASTMAVVLGRLDAWGLEPLDDGEADAVLLPDGGVRIYCTPIVPEGVRTAEALADDTPTEDLEGAA